MKARKRFVFQDVKNIIIETGDENLETEIVLINGNIRECRQPSLILLFKACRRRVTKFCCVDQMFFFSVVFSISLFSLCPTSLNERYPVVLILFQLCS